MPSRSDVEAAEPGATDEGLLATALRGKKSADRVAALKALLRRGSASARPVLGKIAVDTSAPVELRTTALVALGRRAAPENEQTLVQSLSAKEPPVVAAAAESIARIGGRAAFDALSKVDTAAMPGAARGVAFARTLLSYRLGLGTNRLTDPAPDAILELDAERAEPLRLEGVPPGDLEAARRSLDRELPAISVSERGSVRFSCGGERLWLLLTDAMVAAGDRGAMDADMVAAVVLKESQCPDGWFLSEYVLAHPRPGGAALFGVRSTGRVMHHGELRQAGAAATVHLRSLDAPGALALELEADVVVPEGRFVVRVGMSGPPRRTRRNTPVLPRRAPARGRGPED